MLVDGPAWLRYEMHCEKPGTAPSERLRRETGLSPRFFTCAEGFLLLLYRLMKCLREGIEPDSDVYDAVAWSVIAPLSEISVADKSRPVDFPDFTRGKWRERQPLGIVDA